MCPCYTKAMNKTVAVLGADGRSGRECVAALLAAGFTVKAGVHSGKLQDQAKLTQQTCDVMKVGDITSLVNGCSAVVSMIGHGKNSPATLQTTAMQNILDATDGNSDIRIISLTGTGVRQPGDKPNLIDYILNISIKLIDPNRINDGIQHVKALQASNASWTILRVLKLTGGNQSDTVKLTSGGPAEIFTPRARVAAAIVQIIQDDSFHRAMPVVSKS